MRSGSTPVAQWTSPDVRTMLTAALPSRIVIVGGGMAGLEVAARLSSEGVENIVVLEAGPVGDLRHNNMATTADAALRSWLIPETDPYFACPWRSINPPHYTGPSGLRRRLGGRSLYWYGVALPVDPWALLDATAWPREVVVDLVESWLGGPGLYDLTRDMLARWKGDILETDETASVMSICGLLLRPTPRAICHGRSASDHWYAYSPLDAWRDPATGTLTSAPDGVMLVTGARVEQLVIKDKLIGLAVSADDGIPAIHVPATIVVLAAGTLENTRLAIQALTAAGALEAPRLRGISDHIVQGFFLRLPAADGTALTGVLPWGSHYASCEASARSNLFIDISWQGRDMVLVDVRVTGEQLPDDQNWAECEIDTSPPWGLSVHATPSRTDWTVINAQRMLLQSVWDVVATATGRRASTLDFGEFENPTRTNAYILPELIQQTELGVPLTWSSYLGVEDHEAGTLPLNDVLTSDHEFAKIDGLFAAGPSTFPRMGAANPTLTTLALARRLAHVLADRVTRGCAQEFI